MAFRIMMNTPMLRKDEVTTITFKERELVFKHVVGSGKWGEEKGGDDDSQSEEEEEAQPPTDDMEVQVVEISAKVPFFYMEHHPRVLHVMPCHWHTMPLTNHVHNQLLCCPQTH